MGIVSFERIEKIYPNQASSADPDFAGQYVTPLGPTSVTSRPTLFDPLWGYFTFTQEIGFEYDDATSYQTGATFVIEGTFTKDAVLNDHHSPVSDETAFIAMTAKYTALETLFNNASRAAVPSDVNHWSTVLDPRAIVLPLPLVDEDDNRIYVQPLEISILPGTWPTEVKYRATLKEMQSPSAQILVNGQLVDNATIVYDLPKPLMTRTTMPGCIGEAIQIHNYSGLEIEVSGIMPITPAPSSSAFASGTHVISQRAKALINAVEQVNVKIEVVQPSGGTYVKSTLHQLMTRVPPTPFDFVPEDGYVQFTIRCRE